MNYYIDPSVHVIDTERAFIISTKTINLQFNLKEEHKPKVYETIHLLKSNKIDIVDVLQDSSFESQLIKVLINKGIIQEATNLTHTNPFNEIQRIFGDKELLNVLQETIVDEWKISESNNLVSLDAPNIGECDTKRDIFIYALRDSMLVSMNKIEDCADERVTNCHQLQYMALVLVEKIDEVMQRLTEIESVKIDLSFYENELTTIVMDTINEHNFFSSMFTADIFPHIRTDVDYERFFPLVHLTYSDTKKEKQMQALGFDKADCTRNLLFLLRDVYDEITIEENHHEVEHTLNTPSFIGKFIHLYFGKELYVVEEGNKQVLSLDTCKLIISTEEHRGKEYSYFLTCYVNEHNEYKGGIRDGAVPIQL